MAPRGRQNGQAAAQRAQPRVPGLLRKQIAALEAEGWIVTVHHAGIRLPGQRGWTTNVFVIPALLPAVQSLPPAARERARKLLLGERVRDTLMTKGYARHLRPPGT